MEDLEHNAKLALAEFKDAFKNLVQAEAELDNKQIGEFEIDETRISEDVAEDMANHIEQCLYERLTDSEFAQLQNILQNHMSEIIDFEEIEQLNKDAAEDAKDCVWNN